MPVVLPSATSVPAAATAATAPSTTTTSVAAPTSSIALAPGGSGRGLAECTTLAIVEPPVDFARVLKSDPPLAERAAAVLAAPVNLREVAAARLAAARTDPEFGEVEVGLCTTILEALGAAGAV